MTAYHLLNHSYEKNYLLARQYLNGMKSSTLIIRSPHGVRTPLILLCADVRN